MHIDFRGKKNAKKKGGKMIGDIIRIGVMLVCGVAGIGSFGKYLAADIGLIIGSTIGIALTTSVLIINYLNKRKVSWITR